MQEGTAEGPGPRAQFELWEQAQFKLNKLGLGGVSGLERARHTQHCIVFSCLLRKQEKSPAAQQLRPFARRQRGTRVSTRSHV